MFHFSARRKFNIELIRIRGANTNKALNLFDFSMGAPCLLFDRDTGIYYGWIDRIMSGDVLFREDTAYSVKLYFVDAVSSSQKIGKPIPSRPIKDVSGIVWISNKQTNRSKECNKANK